jgi:O-antigen ligase
MLAFVALLLIAVFLAPEVLQQRILSIFDLSVPSTQVRLVHWQHALEMIRHRPIFGFGWIDLAQIHRQMIPLDPTLPENVAWDVYNIGHFHNNLVMWMMNWGIPGLLLVLAFFVRLAQRLWQNMRAFADDRFMGALALGAFAAVTGYFLNGFFDWTSGDAETVTILWIGLGVALVGIGTRKA